MSENKPLFGSATNSASGDAQKPMFGQTSSNTGSSGGLFGQGSNNATPSLFGNTSGAASPFGGLGQNSTSSVFGGAGAAGGSGFGFGGKPADNASGSAGQSSNLFGSNANASSAPGASGSTTPTANKTGFSFGNANSFTPAGPPPTNSMFNLGNTAKNSSSLFGSKSTEQPTSAPTNMTAFGQQPQSTSQPSSLFGGTGAAKTPSLFGSTPVATPSTGGLFGTPSTGDSAAETSSSAPATKPNLFQFPSTGASAPSTNNSEATQKQAEAKAPAFSFPTTSTAASGTSTPTTEKPNLFGTTPSSTAQTSNNLFGSAPAGNSAASNMFAKLGEKKDAPASAATAAPAFGSFGKKADAAPPSTASNAFGSFGAKQPETTSAPATASLFGAPTANKDTSSTTPAASPFTLGQKKDAPAADTTATKPTDSSATNSAAPATATATAPLFGSAPTKPAESTTANSLFGASAAKPADAASAQTNATPAAASANAGANNLGASTTGPTPTPQSRLKNKSMDEIITRWASDLSKYQKEFQAQAEKVASWDRMLLENGNAISKLYSKTFQAERDVSEVQKQLSAVESHQDELSQWLDRYEREVDEMMARQVGQGEGLQGPDQERERTYVTRTILHYLQANFLTRYKTAERVSERLTDMSKDLTTMIEEINDVSSAISKTSKTDDPVSCATGTFDRFLRLNMLLALTNRPCPQCTLVTTAAHRPGCSGATG